MTSPDESAVEIEPMPDDIARLAERITGEPQAPAAYRAMLARVRSGEASWQAWWADPDSEEQGGRLLRAVITAQLAEVRELMDLPPREEQD